MHTVPTFSRRTFVTLAAAAIPGFHLAGFDSVLEASTQGHGPRPPALSADDAWQRLLEGNARFVKGQTTGPRRSPDEFRLLASGQYPSAVILSCSDSRVAPEILFDVGVGDVFIVRVAGNVVSGAGVTVAGSIEYAIAELQVPLIVVLGHSGCGAVKAAKEDIDNKHSEPGAIDGLVHLIRPAVVQSRNMPGDPMENAIKANVLIGVERLKTLKPVIAPRVAGGQVKVQGAVYDLATGAVTPLS
jgi:carbonic anhydrase